MLTPEQNTPMEITAEHPFDKCYLDIVANKMSKRYSELCGESSAKVWHTKILQTDQGYKCINGLFRNT